MSNVFTAAAALMSKAQLAFHEAMFGDPRGPTDKSIKSAVTQIRSLLKEWQETDALVRKHFTTLLNSITGMCKHKGAKRGYNERDGSWMSPCPTCGYSE